MSRETLIKVLKNLLVALVTAFVVLVYLEFSRGIRIPGLEPFVLAAYFLVLWRYNVLRECHPAGIWSGLYLVVILLQVVVGISQILTAT